MSKLRALSLAITILISGAAQAQTAPFTPAIVTKLAQSSFQEYLDFLAMPSDSIVPADIQKNADYIERAFQKRGFTTKQDGRAHV